MQLQSPGMRRLHGILQRIQSRLQHASGRLGHRIAVRRIVGVAVRPHLKKHGVQPAADASLHQRIDALPRGVRRTPQPAVQLDI